MALDSSLDGFVLAYLGRPTTKRFDASARSAVLEFIQKRAHPSLGTGVIDNARAQDGALRFLQEAERQANERGLVEVDAQSIRISIRALCPGLYPFC